MNESLYLPSPRELKQTYRLTETQNDFIRLSREKIINILNGRDSRLLLIVGPCSIHDCRAARDYAVKLKNLSNELEKDFFVVMRTYFEKPRTSIGWKGLVYDPYINQSFAMETGVRLSRQLLLDLADLQLPTATEFLDPIISQYYDDLISWGCIGARTTSSQPHREMASGLSMPIGFKNSTDGNIDTAINGVLAAAVSQSFIGINEDGRVMGIRSSGNKNCHIVLRGAEMYENYDPSSIDLALKKLDNVELSQQLLIDCSHDNSRRNPEKQGKVFESVLNQYIEGNVSIRGMLLESNLQSGQQPISTELLYGVSITDPCLDWESTVRLIKWGSKRLSRVTMASKHV